MPSIRQVCFQTSKLSCTEAMSITFWAQITGVRFCHCVSVHFHCAYNNIHFSLGLCYAVIFGQVTAIVQQAQKKSEGYHQTLDNMRSFCKLYNVPKEISTRIIDYYMYTWVLNRGVDTTQVNEN